MPNVKFNFEYDRRLRWAHVGCGDHSYRNILPAFRYCPIDLVTVCDRRPDRADSFARVFGATHACSRYEEILADDRIEVISLVMGLDERARIVYPELAEQALRAGKHVWIEKPPANNVDEVRRLIDAERETGERVFCGFKKMYFPSVMRAASIIHSPEFGPPTQFTCRYPQSLPTREQIETDPWAIAGFRDHLCHPASIALRLMGRIRELLYIREETHGGVMALLRFANGTAGTMHLCPGQGNSGPMERTEVIGTKGGHLVIDNQIDLHWYRHGESKPYGRAPDFTSEPTSAALHWQPEFSLGVLYNSGLFLLGYATELNHFCQAILEDAPFDCAGSADMLHLTAVYEAFAHQKAGAWIQIIEDE